MRRNTTVRYCHRMGGALLVGSLVLVPAHGQSATGPEIDEMIVTAQKREENINEVPMSIQAASGEALADLGITDTSELYKVVTGFNANVTYYGTTIYTIRGVGFQDTALASGPTVSVYIDEAPLPFSAMTSGLNLDLQRVEALKGPQGTLFGQNATGGAVNYVANKPTDTFEAGIDLSYGRYNDTDVTGFISGPLTETLKARVALRRRTSDGWQESYTEQGRLPADPYWTKAGDRYSFDNEAGDQDFFAGRASIQWDPSDAFTALLTLSGFQDKGDSQRPQLFGFAALNQTNGLNPLISNYPLAPRENEAADWGPCVNVNGGSPALVTGESNLDGSISGEVDPDGEAENLTNRLYQSCKQADKNNDFVSGTLRMDWGITDDLTITSLTSIGKFDRDQRLESDGMIYQDYESFQTGFLKSVFQELRLSGTVMGEGSWVVGVNYERTSTFDSFLQTYGMSTAVPTQVFTRTPLGPTTPNSRQKTKTYAVFANIEYPVLDNLTAQAGVRYTDQQRDYRGCGSDGGDGTWADISAEIQQLLQLLNEGVPFAQTNGLDAGPGKCASTGPAPTYFPEPEGFTGELDQDNISWRVGVTWAFADDMLGYANISQGYKSGSFPTVASAAFTQLFPAKQESLLAYEVGTKLQLFEGTLQLNAAAFYYDYTDKQVLGAIDDPIFGSLPALVNVPDSHVVGGEFSAEWYPIEGLRIAPSLSYSRSEIDGEFRNFDPFFNTALNGSTKSFAGQPFPNAPKWQANLDVQYEWNLFGDATAFVGANLNYQSETNGFFYDECKERGTDPIKGIPITCTKTFLAAQRDADGVLLRGNAARDSELVINARTLLDMRAGVEAGKWRAVLWARNVTDKYYWTQAQHVNDVLLRFTGMPRTYGLTVSYRAE